MRQLEVEILHTPDCPHWKAARQRVQSLAGDEGIPVRIVETSVDTPSEARARHFPGSPTVLIDGEDIEPLAGGAPADYGLG